MLFRLVLIGASLIACSLALNIQSEAECPSNYAWAFNSASQSPCLAAATIDAACSSGVRIWALEYGYEPLLTYFSSLECSSPEWYHCIHFARWPNCHTLHLVGVTLFDFFAAIHLSLPAPGHLTTLSALVQFVRVFQMRRGKND